MQVDSHLDRFMTDLRKRIAARGEGAGTAPDVDHISETIHLALKTRDAEAASSKAALAMPAAGADTAVHSVGVSAPMSVPAARKDVTAMELCKPPGASGASLRPCVLRCVRCRGGLCSFLAAWCSEVRCTSTAQDCLPYGDPACLSSQH